MRAAEGRVTTHLDFQLCRFSPSSSPSLRFPFSYKPSILRFSSSFGLQIFSFRPIRTNQAVRVVAMASTPSEEATRFSVLFVCLGNICRSPAAEGVFTDIVRRKGLLPKFKIDSAGTINYHEGNQADPRMRAASKKRGVEITSISRPIRLSDFKDFDLILAMDMQNRDDILAAYERWKAKESLPADCPKKVKLMCSYCKKHTESEVPDPYYGGTRGFEKVLDILEDACETLLDNIVAENKHIFGHSS